MITRDLFKLSHLSAPGHANFGTREECEAWRARDPVQLKLSGEQPLDYVIEPEPYCNVCGKAYWDPGCESLTMWGNGSVRCGRHHDRNPCAVEGCQRSRSAEGRELRSDQWLCSEHWRRYVSPRSRRRGLYHAYFRKAKRFGWSLRLITQFERFWDRLILDVRRRATEGDLDLAQIEKMFGL